MNRVICQLSFRESWPWVAPVLVALIAWILLSPSPLRYFDASTTVLGLFLGFLAGFRIFRDTGGVRPFLFSRSFSPVRLFTVRWFFGMGILLVAWLAVTLLLVTGLRQGVQVFLFENGWYPMVRWMELQVLFCLVLSTLLAYQGTVFFVVWYRFLGRRRFRGIVRFGHVLLTILFTLSLVPLVLAAGSLLVTDVFYGAFSTSARAMPLPWSVLPWTLLVLGLPALLQTILVPFAGRFCYKNQEIES